MEILLIVPDSSCPRCDETYARIKKAAKDMEPQPTIRKILYSSEEARQFGKVGAAHEIAEWSGLEIDWKKVRMVRELAAEQWTPELDQLLMPLKEKAEQERWLLTPVILIDRKVVHFGSVPKIDDLKSWLVEK